MPPEPEKNLSSSELNIGKRAAPFPPKPAEDIRETPTPPPAPPPPPPKIERIGKPPPTIPTLRTLEQDVEGAVKGGEITLSKMVARPQISAAEPQEEKGRAFNLLAVLGALGLLAIGALLFYVAASSTKREAPAKPAQKIIEADSRADYVLEKEDDPRRNTARVAFLRENAKGALGSLLELRFFFSGETPEPINTEGFLSSTGAQAPSSLIRALSEKYVVGVHVFGNNELFLIFQTEDRDQVFASMLEWEKNMIEDIGSLFRPQRDFDKSADPVIAPNAFEDRVTRNRDTRVVKNKDGKIVLLWGFANDKTLVIAGSENTFGEVLSRIYRIGVSTN